MKKGFTLIEVLSVIVILGVVALIAFPAVDSVIKNSRQKAYEQNIEHIEAAAMSYSVSNDLGYETTEYKIEIADLQNAGLLDDEDIKDPRSKDASMGGCVVYKWIEVKQQYEFNYMAQNCASYTSYKNR